MSSSYRVNEDGGIIIGSEAEKLVNYNPSESQTCCSPNKKHSKNFLTKIQDKDLNSQDFFRCTGVDISAFQFEAS